MPVPYSALLPGWRVLVAEDSYFVAQELAEMLEREGAHVVGPVSTVEDAGRLARSTLNLDAAVLDVNLRGEFIWHVADHLAQRAVTLVFATGYAAAPLKERYASCQVFVKPTPPRTIIRGLADIQLSRNQS